MTKHRWRPSDIDSLFGLPLTGIVDLSYASMRARRNPAACEARRLVDALWLRYRDRATRQWVTQFPLRMHDRFWEMYLTVCLRDGGLEVAPPSSILRDVGPDVRIIRQGLPTIVVEATCIEPGDPTNTNCVPIYPPSVRGAFEVRNHPEEQVILRYTAALHAKARQRERHVANGLFDAQSPFVIAINAGGCTEALFSPLQPMVLKALFPVGHPYLSIDTLTGRSIGGGWTTRLQIFKSSSGAGTSGLGSAVPTTMFSGQEFTNVSAILHSGMNVANQVRLSGEAEGADFVIIHNPNAASPLARGLLPAIEEIDPVWADDETLDLRRRPGRCPLRRVSDPDGREAEQPNGSKQAAVAPDSCGTAIVKGYRRP
jgi:hypothetical protein